MATLQCLVCHQRRPGAHVVGASSLAKNVNDNACRLVYRGVLEFFASKLAPTPAAPLQMHPGAATTAQAPAPRPPSATAMHAH
ncbi:hypothetical protein CI807_05590 [Pseudomonas sp. NS1(2017)]|nr:hypothetical protein CI807_05590 [Pseudomonas sp. NS1(2017)]